MRGLVLTLLFAVSLWGRIDVDELIQELKIKARSELNASAKANTKTETAVDLVASSEKEVNDELNASENENEEGNETESFFDYFSEQVLPNLRTEGNDTSGEEENEEENRSTINVMEQNITSSKIGQEQNTSVFDEVISESLESTKEESTEKIEPKTIAEKPKSAESKKEVKPVVQSAPKKEEARVQVESSKKPVVKKPEPKKPIPKPEPKKIPKTKTVAKNLNHPTTITTISPEDNASKSGIELSVSTLEWIALAQVGVIVLLLVLLFRSNKKLTQTLENIINSQATLKNSEEGHETQSFLQEEQDNKSGAHDLRNTLL